MKEILGVTQELIAAAHVPLLLILCVSGRSPCCAAYSSADKGTPTGIAIADIVTDNGACDAANGCPGEGPGLGVRPGGTTRENKREDGSEAGKEFGFHDLFGFNFFGYLNHFRFARQPKESIVLPKLGRSNDRSIQNLPDQFRPMVDKPCIELEKGGSCCKFLSGIGSRHDAAYPDDRNLAP